MTGARWLGGPGATRPVTAAALLSLLLVVATADGARAQHPADASSGEVTSSRPEGPAKPSASDGPVVPPLTALGPDDSPGAAVVARADDLFAASRVGESLDVLETMIEHDGGTYGVLWRAARDEVTLGLLAHGRSAQNSRFERGADYARRATILAPWRLEGHYWWAAGAGLHAVQGESHRLMARLGQVAYDQAQAALRIDPDDPASEHVLGRVNFEVMNLPFLDRLFGRAVLGSAVLGQASWTGAERHLERAVELDPKAISYRVDLARFYLRRDRPSEAARELETALRLDRTRPADSLYQAKARKLLRSRGLGPAPASAGARAQGAGGPALAVGRGSGPS